MGAKVKEEKAAGMARKVEARVMGNVGTADSMDIQHASALCRASCTEESGQPVHRQRRPSKAKVATTV